MQDWQARGDVQLFAFCPVVAPRAPSGSEVEEGLGREDGGRRPGKETGRKGRGDGEGKGAGGLVMFIKQKIAPGAPGEGEDRVRKGTRGALPSVLEPLEGPGEVHWPPRNAQK